MTRTLECLFAAVWAFLAFALYAAVFLVAPICIAAAFAHDGYRCHYVTRSRPAYDTWLGTVTTQYYQQRQCVRNRTYYLPEREPTRVYGYERRRDRDDDREYAGGVHCKPRIRVTGDDKLQENNAEISAQERWALEIEGNFGTLYSDIRYARNMRLTCVRKVPASVTERGQAALGVRHHVCSFEGEPCRAPAVRVDEDSRAKRRSDKVEEPPPRRDR